jgi:hypothetical protein
MGRYTADPTKDTAGFPVLPKADYRLSIGEPKAFKGETKEGPNAGQENYGVAFLCTVVEGPVDEEGSVSPSEHKAKKCYNRLYYHTQDSRNFSKGFILAGFGFSPKEEEVFNQKIAELREQNPEDPALDWSFDPDTGECGEAWRALTNREIVASLSVVKDKKDQEQQKWDMVRPVPVPE